MSHPVWSWTFERVIPSKVGAHQSIVEEILDRLEQEQWSTHDVFSVRMALEEALCNAIKHGNRLDHEKKVAICGKMSPSRLWIRVSDEGAGFRPEHVPDCTDPANIERPCGRGIMLMRCYMNRVEYNEAGNVVEMEKERAGSVEPV
ncbi:MAG TPA: ATP-binding protein [Pirellulales bacterium]|nr:ATP-binding protein [Pirellulales bacterium]